MSWLETPHERRRTMRVRSKGTALLHHGGRPIRGRILDLAAGGVRIRAELALGLAHLEGRHVHVELRLDGATAKWFLLCGHVLRTSVEEMTIAIALDDVPSDFEDCTQNERLAATEQQSIPQVILVDEATPRRAEVAEAFRNAGCHVIEASTPLEAIVRLGESQFEPGVVALADTIPERTAESLREFLGTDHPLARVVQVGASDRDSTQGWIGAYDPPRGLEERPPTTPRPLRPLTPVSPRARRRHIRHARHVELARRKSRV